MKFIIFPILFLFSLSAIGQEDNQAQTYPVNADSKKHYEQPMYVQMEDMLEDTRDRIDDIEDMLEDIKDRIEDGIDIESIEVRIEGRIESLLEDTRGRVNDIEDIENILEGITDINNIKGIKEIENMIDIKYILEDIEDIKDRIDNLEDMIREMKYGNAPLKGKGDWRVIESAPAD